ncbi:uncharacterized protein PODANS_6_9010 [Podospora anserina S mat+]|uniref:Podospora anserina S mat+ genomic DNA chromosome 6, supercontig 4 n=1 Tax=Podospora anserina (strain S / ATCC MYA-4624 / DSM 980 / FGSC 10383) TaxID=515849 RepID=B2AN53_PODAN|nr:uncharacterized protein PODANS_6_9010 [Podospora anserina S mat+]CAP65397.1 unnamed protein product [Podospora anserina S mat+]
MSSRFVSAGSIDATTGEATTEHAGPSDSQQQQPPPKSLYEVLQANKAAKQAEFEEKSKLKNQFRALDEDEIDFLDEVERRRRGGRGNADDGGGGGVEGV